MVVVYVEDDGGFCFLFNSFALFCSFVKKMVDEEGLKGEIRREEDIDMTCNECLVAKYRDHKSIFFFFEKRGFILLKFQNMGRLV